MITLESSWLCRFLLLLNQPELSLRVRQRHPINDTLSYTLKIESHLQVTRMSTCSVVNANDSQCAKTCFDHATVGNEDKMLNLIHMLITRIDSLEMKVSVKNPVMCKKCSKNDHFTRSCAAACVNTAEDITGGSIHLNSAGAQKQALKGVTEVQKLCNEPSSKIDFIKLSDVTPMCAYHVTGELMKGKIQFMIDTGATVSLIQEDSWKEAVDSQSVLSLWTGCELIGVEGSKITVKGGATLITGVMVA